MANRSDYFQDRQQGRFNQSRGQRGRGRHSHEEYNRGQGRGRSSNDGFNAADNDQDYFNFNDDDRFSEDTNFGGRYQQDSEYSTKFQQDWNEDAEGYGDRSQRRQSLSRNQRSSHSPDQNHRPQSDYGGRDYSSRGSINEPWRRGNLDYAGDRSSYQSGQNDRNRDYQMERRNSFSSEQDRESRIDYMGRGPKGYQRSDERIREEVCDCLADHGDVDASEIEVKVEAGEVTLTGTVDNRRAKRLAEDAITHLRGVKDVHNQIRVQASTEASTTKLTAQPAGNATKKKGDSLHS